MGAKEADIWPAVTVPCLMARRPGIWLEFRAASETCCRTRAAAAFPNQQNKIPGWQRGRGGALLFFFLHSPAACRRTQRQIQSWHRMKLCLACGAVERSLLDCVWHLIQDSGQAFWNCGWIFHGLMDWDPAWNDVGAAAAPSLNVNAERSEILSMFPEKERQDVYKELRGGLIVLHISADAILLYFILFFLLMHYIFFFRRQGQRQHGFLSRLKSSECTVHQAHSQRGNISLRAFNIWIVSRTPSINHITPVLQQLHWLPVKFHMDFEILPPHIQGHPQYRLMYVHSVAESRWNTRILFVTLPARDLTEFRRYCDLLRRNTVEPLFEKTNKPTTFSAWNSHSLKNTSNYPLEK